MTTITEHRIQLPITKPLLQNERLHWAARARRTKEIRQAVALLAKTGPFKIPGDCPTCPDLAEVGEPNG